MEEPEHLLNAKETFPEEIHVVVVLWPMEHQQLNACLHYVGLTKPVYRSIYFAAAASFPSSETHPRTFNL